MEPIEGMVAELLIRTIILMQEISQKSREDVLAALKDGKVTTQELLGKLR